MKGVKAALKQEQLAAVVVRIQVMMTMTRKVEMIAVMTKMKVHLKHHHLTLRLRNHLHQKNHRMMKKRKIKKNPLQKLTQLLMKG